MSNAKTILITGTSSGFGRLAVPLLLERGHTVIAGLRGGQARLEAVFPVELKRYGSKLLGVDLHMERPETFTQALTLLESRFEGKLDVLVNNAGYGLFGTLEDQTSEQLRHQFDVNFFGPVELTRILLPGLRKARGRVLNISSIVGLITLPLYGAYSASKYALEAITEGMYYDLQPHGVQVSLIEPGGFNTDFSGRSKFFGERSFAPESFSAKRGEALLRMFASSNKRMGNPIQVARRIVSLSEKGCIPLRSPVGIDSRFMVFFRKFAPDAFRAWIFRLAFKIFVFRD